jgi:tellurite resistance protein
MRKRSPADFADALINLLVKTANEESVSPEVLEGYRTMLRSTHALQSAADDATLEQFRAAANRFRELKQKEIQDKALMEPQPPCVG